MEDATQEELIVAISQHFKNPAPFKEPDGSPKVQCHSCIHARGVPGNAHLLCTKPGPEITGHPHGIMKGWFAFPMLFDPTWHTTECPRFESVALTVDPAVSRAVSPTVQ
jgi:hypothetical protein